MLSNPGRWSDRSQLFDPWEQIAAPAFPTDILPETLARFVESTSVRMGCDASGLAMSVIGAVSGALDHRFSLNLLRNGSYQVSPRLWILLVGPPSSKKTPMVSAAMRPLEIRQKRLTKIHQEAVQAHLREGGKPEDPPPSPTRYIAVDTTIEALAKLLSGQDRGILVRRDEIAAWVGSMEKYGGGGGAADRGFWLESFNGGYYVSDRINRGQSFVENLSVSMLGGIQPNRLRELHGLSSDGLLQRFIPVMLNNAAFRKDIPLDGSEAGYATLVDACVDAEPKSLSMTDDAVDALEDLHRHLHEIEQHSSGLAEGYPSFVGKLSGISGSLCLILHLMRAATAKAGAPTRVSPATVYGVQRLIRDFVLPHSLAFYRHGENGGRDMDGLCRIASYLLTSRKDRFTPSDFTTNVRSLRGMGAKALSDAISPLVAGGWLTEDKAGGFVRAWHLDPSVRPHFEARRDEEERCKQEIARLMNGPRHPVSTPV